jgi:hypothetical protein
MSAADVQSLVRGLRIDDVELEPAPDADGCGALGCRKQRRLVRGVIQGFGQRVLCPDHMASLIQREVLNDV